MPKTSIQAKNLPAPNGYTESYSVRFRIITDNQNNFSSWSPIYEIPINVSYTVTEPELNHNSGIVSMSWPTVNDVYKYDIWIAWDDGTNPNTWIYYERTTATFSFASVPLGKNKFSVRIYHQVNPTSEQFSNFLIYEKLNFGV